MDLGPRAPLLRDTGPRTTAPLYHWTFYHHIARVTPEWKELVEGLCNDLKAVSREADFKRKLRLLFFGERVAFDLA